MARSLIWSATWQMTRNAQMRARDFVSWSSAVPTPRPSSVCSSRSRPGDRRGGELQRSAWRRVVPSCSPVSAMVPECRARPAGVRPCLRQRRTGRRVHRVIRGLLDLDGAASAAGLLPGFTVDQDLRWRLLTRWSERPTPVRHHPHRRAGRGLIATGGRRQVVLRQMNAVGPGRPTRRRRQAPPGTRSPCAVEMSTSRCATMAGITHVGQDALLSRSARVRRTATDILS